jgi:K+ transporter
MFKIDIKDVWTFIEPRWYRRSTLVIVVLVLIIFLLVLFSAINLRQISGGEVIVIAVGIVIISLVWFFTTRLPKARKGTVGFAVDLPPI